MDELLRYFPGLSAEQKERFSALKGLYEDWNAQINVISRRDMERFYLHHVLHSLAIARTVGFAPGSRVLDAGTGGGFPGIPLAVFFPEASFTLADSIGKKIKVAADVARQLSLDNVLAVNTRMEDLAQKFDFAVCRAVAPMDSLAHWLKGKIRKGTASTLANGILCLKGGDLAEELRGFPQARIYAISSFFPEDFFTAKCVVYLPVS